MLGVGIPYYKNSNECEIAFKKLMKTLEIQLKDNTCLYIYEDGQVSEWLYSYQNHTYIESNPINHGIAKVRNIIKDYLIDKLHCDYILFLDSDDMVDCDFISQTLEAISKKEYDMIISPFYMNKEEMLYNLRSNVAGITLKSDFIKDIRFDEKYNISEDTIFINEVYKRNPKIYSITSRYLYNYGINPNSLMKRFERSEIKLEKENKK